MSDQINLPRVEFNGNGLSMDIDQAVSKFREILEHGQGHFPFGYDSYRIKLNVEMRPCDCSETLEGIDEHCPEHGSIDPEGECPPRLKQIFDRVDLLSDEEFVSLQAYMAMRRV